MSYRWKNERKPLPQRGNNSLLSYLTFFPVGVVERLHLALPAEQAGLKKKEVKTVPFKPSYLFIHSTDIYSVPTMN